MGHEDIQGRVAGDTDFQADGKPVACGGGDGSCCLNRVIHRPAQQKLVLVRAAGRQVACHHSVLPLLSEALLSVESGSPANRACGAGKRRVGRARPLLSALADPSHLERSYLARLRGEAGTYSPAITTSCGRKSGGSQSVPSAVGQCQSRDSLGTAESGGLAGNPARLRPSSLAQI